MSLDRKRLKREIETERRRKVKARLRELRPLIRAERAARRERIQGIRQDCRQARQQLATNCALRRQRAHEEGGERIAAAQAELQEVKRGELVTRQGDSRLRKASIRRSTSTERRQESDDEVLSNISDQLRPVFLKVKRHIKGSPRKTRTEAFLEWTEENPDEIHAFQNADADAYLRRLLAEQADLERQQRRAARVPF